MASEYAFWAVAVPVIALTLLMFSIVFRLTKRKKFSIQLKGFGVELKVSSDTLDTGHVTKDHHEEIN